MLIHRARGDAEDCANFKVGFASANPTGNLLLPLAQAQEIRLGSQDGRKLLQRLQIILERGLQFASQRQTMESHNQMRAEQFENDAVALAVIGRLARLDVCERSYRHRQIDFVAGIPFMNNAEFIRRVSLAGNKIHDSKYCKI